MKNLVFILLAFFMISCNNCNNHKADKTTVIKVIDDFVTAVQNKDYGKLDDLASDDFVIYENGLVWNMDEFSLKLEEYDSVGINYKITNMHAIVDENTAQAWFHNKGTFVYPDTTIVLNFIESATLVKDDKNNWQIIFYHSTHLK